MRFDPKTSPLLNMMSQGNSLLDLMLVEPVRPITGVAFQKIAAEHGIKTIEQARKAPGHVLDTISDKMREVFPEIDYNVSRYVEELDRYYKDKTMYDGPNDRVRWPMSYYNGYNQMNQTTASVSLSVENILSAHLPTAYYIPVATEQAFVVARSSIQKNMDKLWADVTPHTALLIYGRDNNRGVDYNTIYAYDITPQHLTVLFIIEKRSNGRNQPFITGMLHATNGVDPIIHATKIPGKDAQENAQDFNSAFEILLQRILFIHFFKLEVVRLEQPQPRSGRSVRIEVQDQKIETTIAYPIQVVDARWYTTAIRDSPFAVSGHFRNQPKGPGRSQTEMIYINPFIKHGYHREAQRGKSKRSNAQ